MLTVRKYFIVVVLLASFQVGAAPEKKPEAIQVDSLKILDSDVKIPFRYPGVVESQVQGKLVSETQGIVTKVRKRLGERVRKNEIIFYVKNYQVGLNYNSYGVRAPVAGIVSHLDIEVGQALKPGQVVGEVIRPGQLKIIVQIPASDLPDINNKSEAFFETANRKIKLKVRGISPVVNSMTGTAEAELIPESGDENSKVLRPGLVGKVHLFSDSRKIISIPPKALVSIGSRYYVRLIGDDNLIKVQEVKIGRLLGAQQVIESGLTADDEIVLRSMDHLKDGDLVKRRKKDIKKTL